MSRLIDADSLIGELHNTYLYDSDARSVIYRKIDEQPTVDAVPVVRCKDCRYWNKDTITHNENDFRKWDSADCDLFQYRDGYHDCDWSTEEDDFCSYGEKVTE